MDSDHTNGDMYLLGTIKDPGGSLKYQTFYRFDKDGYKNWFWYYDLTASGTTLTFFIEKINYVKSTNTIYGWTESALTTLDKSKIIFLNQATNAVIQIITTSTGVVVTRQIVEV